MTSLNALFVVVVVLCSLLNQQSNIKKKVAANKGSLQTRLGELKKESPAVRGEFRLIDWLLTFIAISAAMAISWPIQVEKNITSHSQN